MAEVLFSGQVLQRGKHGQSMLSKEYWVRLS